MIFAVDPGTTQSAYVFFDSAEQRIVLLGIEDNYSLLRMLHIGTSRVTVFALEVLQSYGMPIGKEVFETAFWIGRFVQAMRGHGAILWPLYRKQVCAHLGAKNDSSVRAALIARFSKEKLTGCVYDIWSALAVAVTASDRIVAGLQPQHINALN